ncbi:MAG: peptide chain release factor N(5)-glutamine methyltransferase [Desulfohalobiaceae bacterium]
METLGHALQQGARYLRHHKVDGPRLSAELILGHVLGISRLELILGQDKIVAKKELHKAWTMLHLRARGCPLAYILGFKEFYGLDFFVNKGVLIPRPETELILDLVQDFLDPAQELFFADVGTGSGALGITFLTLFPRTKGLLLDISSTALEVARQNASKHQMLCRCLLAREDLGSALKPGSLDLVLANPPYLSSSDMAVLSREIKDFEPELALWGGFQGQEMALDLVQNIWPGLKPGGLCLLEAAPRQIANVLQAEELYRLQGLCVEVHKDLADKDRVLVLHKVCDK